MRLRNNPNAKIMLEENSHIVLSNEKNYKLTDIFQNENPTCIEIGMGKGDFIINMALQNPDINYIGVEKFDSVIVVALKKLLGMETIPNLRLLCVDATNLIDIFGCNVFQKVYLNFSDPWPKSRHAKRRLTYKDYLNIYQELLLEDGDLEFKTDNRGLFEYSIISMNQYQMDFIDICLDLHRSEGYEDNIMTEYERKFSPFGPIYKIQARFR